MALMILMAAANAVLTPEQMQSVADGETIEIRIDVKDISGNVSEQDKRAIENGIEEYRKKLSCSVHLLVSNGIGGELVRTDGYGIRLLIHIR